MPGADPKPPEGDREALSQQDAADSGLDDMTAEPLESVKPVDGGIATEGSKGHAFSEGTARTGALAKQDKTPDNVTELMPEAAAVNVAAQIRREPGLPPRASP